MKHTTIILFFLVSGQLYSQRMLKSDSIDVAKKSAENLLCESIGDHPFDQFITFRSIRSSSGVLKRDTDTTYKLTKEFHIVYNVTFYGIVDSLAIRVDLDFDPKFYSFASTISDVLKKDSIALISRHEYKKALRKSNALKAHRTFAFYGYGIIGFFRMKKEKGDPDNCYWSNSINLLTGEVGDKHLSCLD
ncbi:MAG: hypothetical protein QNK23_09160 [Crocinitomicaceae bacterium]|nr:hypothetical protein [Crocinitomicaceae bacterium]